jgi:hypothetical protein
MSGLRPGFTVNLLDETVSPASILICSGSRPFHEAGHATSCVVARDDWRSLDDEEAATVLGSGPRSPSQSLTLLDLGTRLLEEGHRSLLPFLAGQGNGTGSGTGSGPSLVEALRSYQSQVTQTLHERYGIIPETTGAADMIVHRPDQVSTAFNPAAGEFVGLHIDTHQRLPFSERAGAMTLCSVNIGFAERYLDFVNLPVSSLLATLADRGLQAPESSSALKDAFLGAFPGYPVLRLVLQPGQAYLCTTQNTIHDGATNHSALPDISFLTLHRLTDLAPRWAAGLAIGAAGGPA